MIIDCKGKHGPFLCLGTQTNPGNVERNSNWKAIQWAPKKAKSYTIRNLVHTDYYGRSMDKETGYSNFEVYYYTTPKEGEVIIEKRAKMKNENGWIYPKDIEKFPECHSDSMKTIPILMVVYGEEYPVMGRYCKSTDEWYQIGSLSEVKPIKWQPLPKTV